METYLGMRNSISKYGDIFWHEEFYIQIQRHILISVVIFVKLVMGIAQGGLGQAHVHSAIC